MASLERVQLAAGYLERLEAPRKELVWFERSSHYPFFEEPVRFSAEMARVRDEVVGAGVPELGEVEAGATSAP